jgi:exopolyphosphatase/guanosine-5'-triphosphate,3'-diphosphate pyrophosphatase
MRLAAIDIGSNAARLLIQDITTYKDGSLDYTKVNLLRVPLRLGFDVFESGIISEYKTNELIETLKAYRHLMKVYDVKSYRACATSAMRDAKNGKEIVARVQKEIGLNIEIITGSQEAEILYETHLAEKLDNKSNYLYIDVGGGSTELTLYSNNKVTYKQSFNIGTIRLLKNKVDVAIWDEMKVALKKYCKSNTVAIGSGGNINKVFSISKRKNGKPLSLDILKEYYKEMNALTVEERIHKYGFKEDRADVIVPALNIYTTVMRWANISEIFVPQIGLADGIIKLLYKDIYIDQLNRVRG